MNKITGIYKLESPSGKVYIGQSWNILHRWADYGKKTTKSQPKLNHSFIKYGKHAHKYSIIHELPPNIDQEAMDIYEQLYMDLYGACGIELINTREGGSKGKLSEETKKKLSEIGKKLPNRLPIRYGVKPSEETKRKMSESAKGRSPANKGMPMLPHVKANLIRVNTGSKRTEAQKQAASDRMKGTKGDWARSNKGKKRTPEMVEAMRQRLINATHNKGENNHLSKITEKIVLEIRSKFIPRVYSSRKLAAEYGLSKTHILDIVNRKTWRHI